MTNGNVKLQGFSATGKQYVTIQGFEITHSGLTQDPYPGGSTSASIYLSTTDHFKIIGNNIHDTDGTCVLFYGGSPSTASNDVIVKDNVISHCGQLGPSAAGGVYVFGDNNLVDNNDISRNGEDFTRQTGGNFNVIRNNYFHDNLNSDYPGSLAHIDGVQNWCTATVPLSTHYILIEGNYMKNAPDFNSHFSLFQDYGPCGESDAIIRGNVAKNIGSGFGVSDRGFKNGRVYNNSLVDMGIAQNPKPWDIVNFGNGSTGGKVINNIFYNTVRNYGNPYTVDASSTLGFYANNNLGYNTECGSTCVWHNPPGGIEIELNAVINKDPLFTNVDNDFTLQSASPAIDKGGLLTKVATNDSGSGTSLIVNDAGFFQGGWAGISPDWIAVGTASNISQISSIDYSNNTITLSSALSRKAGDPVFLYKDSSGRQVLRGSSPDIGAKEF